MVIEGIDGSGKSSVSRLVAIGLGSRAVLTREPTDSWLGRAVKNGEGRKVSPYTDALLFMADRSVHTLEIAALLRRGKLVISDRYYHSTVAYQAAFLQKDFDGDPFVWLLDANMKISIHPDLTVLLTIPPELGLKRIRGRRKISRFERLGFLRRVNKNYVRLARLDKSIVRVNAARPLNDVAEEVIRLIQQRKL